MEKKLRILMREDLNYDTLGSGDILCHEVGCGKDDCVFNERIEGRCRVSQHRIEALSIDGRAEFILELIENSIFITEEDL